LQMGAGYYPFQGFKCGIVAARRGQLTIPKR